MEYTLIQHQPHPSIGGDQWKPYCSVEWCPPPPPPPGAPPWRGYIREGAPAVPLGDPTMLSFFHRTNRRFKHAFAWIHWNIIHPVLNKSSADLIRWSRDFYSPIYKCLNWDYFETCPLFVYLWKLTQLFAFLSVYPACLFVCLFLSICVFVFCLFVCFYVCQFYPACQNWPISLQLLPFVAIPAITPFAR